MARSATGRMPVKSAGTVINRGGSNVKATAVPPAGLTSLGGGGKRADTASPYGGKREA